LLGGYNFEVPALETAQAKKQIIMSKTADRNLRSGQRDTCEFDLSTNRFNGRR